MDIGPWPRAISNRLTTPSAAVELFAEAIRKLSEAISGETMDTIFGSAVGALESPVWACFSLVTWRLLLFALICYLL